MNADMVLVWGALAAYGLPGLLMGGAYAVIARGQGEPRWIRAGLLGGLFWPWEVLKLLWPEGLIPQLLPDWRDVLRRAWSIRLILLAGLLTGAEALLALAWPGLFGLPPGALAIASAVASAAAFVARLVAQRDS